MNLSPYIDHTLLNPFALNTDINHLISEVLEYTFASVCVSPYYISRVSDKFVGSTIKRCTVIGFPQGHQSLEVKRQELEGVLRLADEFDIVIPLSATTNEQCPAVEQEVRELTSNMQSSNKVIKWIIESYMISEEQLRRVGETMKRAQVNFVKTSTGFNVAETKLEDVKKLRNLLDPKIMLKASGGVKTYEQALALIHEDANRIGCSNSINLIK